MTGNIAEKITKANESMKNLEGKLKQYIVAIGVTAQAFEELATACAEVISQPYIEVDTRDIDG